MADPPLYPDSRERPSTPRWVKVFGVIALLLVVLVVIALLTGGGPGEHGPGRHVSSGGAGGLALLGSHTQPC
jgi:hypothetical protein